MILLFSVIIILACVLLTLIILIQNPKGGGLSATFGGSTANQIMGVQRSTDIVEKATWGFMIGIIALTFFVHTALPDISTGGGDMTQQEQSDLLINQYEGGFAPAANAPVQQRRPAQGAPAAQGGQQQGQPAQGGAQQQQEGAQPLGGPFNDEDGGAEDSAN